MRKLWCDLETYSPTPIKDGTARYAEEAEIMLMSWAIDDGPVNVVDFTDAEDLPFEAQQAAGDPECEVFFQNGTKFDWTVIALKWKTFDHLVPLSRRRDTMVQAYSHSLPGGLEALCDALGVAQDKRKLKTGRDFIRLFCMPPAKNVKRDRATRLTHPVEWTAFKAYAGQDIVAMRECHKRMPDWNYAGKQLLLEQMDARTNARGIYMDTELAEAAVRVSDLAKKGLAVQTKEMTDGEVGAATQRDQMLKFILESYGIDLPDMQKDTIERRANDESLPDELRELLRVRLESTTTSVAKYNTLLRGVSSDGRLRGTQQFRGAARTGRVGHRMFQPGNMPRPNMPWKEIYWAIELLKRDTAHLVYANLMRVCSNAIRGTIIAAPGKKLVVADLANIEGRFAAWLAGEEWKLQAFRDYDTFEGVDEKGKPKRKGHDLYILAYASSFNVPPESIDKATIEGYAKRQIGKVQELMFQYGGGVGAWITGAATYNIDLNAMTEQVYDTIPKWAIEEAESYLQYLYTGARERYEARLTKIAEDGGDLGLAAEAIAVYEAAKLKLRYGLAEKVFVACDAIKRLWRKAHPEISSYWKELENMIRAAIENPGERFTARRLVIHRAGAWLRIRLPSGRLLCYPSPKWDHVIPAEIDLVTGKVLKPAKRFDGFSYMGISQYSKKWTRIGSYGGKIFENCLAGGTEVLTEFGFIPIEDVRARTRVWDGIEWVSHEGCVYRGKQITMSIFNVDMTPDHRVLTTEGWRSASSCEGHHRALCRLPDRPSVSRQRRSPIDLGSELRLRKDDSAQRIGASEAAQTRDCGVMRLHETSIDQCEQHDARHVETSGLRGVAVNGGPVFATFTSSLGQLWRSWNYGLQSVARVVREFLARHGSDLLAWSHARTGQEWSGLFAEELCVGDVQTTSIEHPDESQPRDARRPDERSASGGPLRDQAIDAELPTRPRVVAYESARPVFDLMNCGPRQRFVVRGRDGLLLIVHNCTQAGSCDQLLECGLLIEEAGFEPVLSVHDEWVTEADEDRDDLDDELLGGLMCADLGWNEGLPLAAAGYTAQRYRKDD